MKNSKKRNWNC